MVHFLIESYDRCNKKLYTAGGIETSDGEELNISTAKDLPAIPKIHLKSSSRYNLSHHYYI